MFDARWPFHVRQWLAPGLTVTLKQFPSDVTVCTLTGVLTKDTTRLVKTALTRARHTDDTHLIIDLSPVTCLDLAGLSSLLETRHRHTLNRRGHVAMVAISSLALPQIPTLLSGLRLPSTSTMSWPQPWNPAPTLTAPHNTTHTHNFIRHTPHTAPIEGARP